VIPFPLAPCIPMICAPLLEVIFICYGEGRLRLISVDHHDLGRKEITSFFYLFMLLTVISLCLDSGVVPIGSAPYAYFVAVQAGLTSALCTCLLINGFIGFQVYEDGTPLSVWLLRLSTIAMFVVTGGVAICTFQSWIGLSPTKTMALFIVLYVVNALFLFVYVACQVILVMGTLEDRWPLGDIVFGVFFFVVGQVLLYAFGDKLCDKVYHYLDGLFFSSICNLLGVMMVYKVRLQIPDHFCQKLTRKQYWDSITKEDLEFSVGTKTNVWEVKELIPEEAHTTIYEHTGPTSDYATSTYHSSGGNRVSQGYGGFPERY